MREGGRIICVDPHIALLAPSIKYVLAAAVAFLSDRDAHFHGLQIPLLHMMHFPPAYANILSLTLSMARACVVLYCTRYSTRECKWKKIWNGGASPACQSASGALAWTGPWETIRNILGKSVGSNNSTKDSASS